MTKSKVTICTASGQDTHTPTHWVVEDNILVLEDETSYTCFPLTSILWYQHWKETNND